MKYMVVNALLAASAVQGYLLPPKTKRIDWKHEQKRQIVGMMTTLLGKGGRTIGGWNDAALRQPLRTTSKLPGAKRLKYRYGPYIIPNMNKTSIVGEEGMLWNFPDLNIPKPCTECTIVGQWAGLETPAGQNANIDTGLWLHHMVHLTIGSGRWDPTCYGYPSLPHIDVNSSPQASERYFSSGNERSQVRLDEMGSGEKKAGYHLKSSDSYGFIVDLMNMNSADKTVYLTMYYDYIEGPLPAGWDDIKTIWFDVNQCGTSEYSPPKQSGSFTITSSRWSPNISGRILGVGGHLHDGGISVDINYGTDKTLCKSKAAYAESKEYINWGGKGGMAGMNMKRDISAAAMGVAEKHISSMTECYAGRDPMPVKTVQKGQSWYVQAHYDYSTHTGNKDSRGRQQEVMGIALMFIAIPQGAQPGAAWF